MNKLTSRTRYAFVLIGASVLSTFSLWAQCPPDEEFPYYFCKDNKLTLRCAADPHHVWEDGQQLKPYKRYIPGCLSIERGRAYDIYMPTVGTGEEHYVPVYLVQNESKDITEAFNQWNDLCPPSDADFDCCVKIFFSSDPRDFEDETVGATAEVDINLSACRPTCNDDHRIYINDTPSWLYEKPAPEPSDTLKQSFYTGKYPPSLQYGYRAYSLYQLVENITGYWLGMVSAPEAASSGCGHSTSIMENPYTEDEAQDLTEKDRCQFRKLYCDHEVGLSVEDPTTPSLAFTIVPNPVRSYLTLRLPDDFPAAATLTLRIVDATGSTVQTTHLDEHAREIPVDLSGIPNGVYMLTLSNGARTYGEKIIVQR